MLAVLQQPPGNEPYTRAPRIAPYITNDVLLRVNNQLAELSRRDDECLCGWGVQASLGRVVAALTGAPPPSTMEDALHWGNGMQSRARAFAIRLTTKHAGANRSRAARARMVDDAEKLYICPFRGTPDRPSDDILAAGLQSQPQPVPPPTSTTPVPVQSARKRAHVVLLEPGQMVISSAEYEAWHAEQGTRQGTRHEADTMRMAAWEKDVKIRKLRAEIDAEAARADAAERDAAEAALGRVVAGYRSQGIHHCDCLDARNSFVQSLL